MTLGSKTNAEILAEAIEERAQRIRFTKTDMEPRLARLRAGFAKVDHEIAERRDRLLRALDWLPPERRCGWLEGIQASVQIVLHQAQRTSEILVDAARNLLPVGPDPWSFTPDALVMRDADERVTRADSQDAADPLARTIFVYDRDSEPRFTGIIHNFPNNRPPPCALFVEIVLDDRAPLVLECNPDVEAHPGSICTLRYEPTLPSGTYDVFFGNAQKPDH